MEELVPHQRHRNGCLMRGLPRLAVAFYPDAKGMNLRLLPLAFAGEHVEAHFRQDYHDRSLLLVRFSLVMGMLALGFFGPLDVLFFSPPVTGWLLILRYGLGWAGFAVVLALTYSQLSIRFLQPALACLLVWIGLCIIAMMAVGGAPAHGYYVGVIFCLVFGYTFMRLRFVFAVAGGWLLVLAYGLLALAVVNPPLDMLVTSSMFVLSVNVVGMAINHSLEYYVRREFYLRTKAIEQVLELNEARRVLQRTSVSRQLVGDMLRDMQDVASLSEAGMFRGGNALAQRLGAGSLDEYLGAFADAGLGTLVLTGTDEQKGRWVFRGRGLVEIETGSDLPVCNYARGFLCAVIRRTTGALRVASAETLCEAMGDDACQFFVQIVS